MEGSSRLHGKSETRTMAPANPSNTGSITARGPARLSLRQMRQVIASRPVAHLATLSGLSSRCLVSGRNILPAREASRSSTFQKPQRRQARSGHLLCRIPRGCPIQRGLQTPAHFPGPSEQIQRIIRFSIVSSIRHGQQAATMSTHRRT